MPDVYPADVAQRIRDLEKAVEELKASLGSREPLTAASQGWLLSNMSIPSVSTGQVHIGANNNELYAQTINGTKYMMYKASHVSPVSGTVGATYTTFEQGKINELITVLAAVISSLVSAGHMDT